MTEEHLLLAYRDPTSFLRQVRKNEIPGIKRSDADKLVVLLHGVNGEGLVKPVREVPKMKPTGSMIGMNLSPGLPHLQTNKHLIPPYKPPAPQRGFLVQKPK